MKIPKIDRARRTPFRAIALDYDGTLTSGERPVSRRVINLLSQAKGFGILLFLVSGRELQFLERVSKETSFVWDALVSENGAIVKIGDAVFTFGESEGRKICDAFRSWQGPADVRALSVSVPTRLKEDVFRFISDKGLRCRVEFNRDQLMVLPTRASKSRAMMFLCDKFKIDLLDNVYVADAENDIDMFRLPGLKVAVGNAVTELKRLADIVLAKEAGAGVCDYLTDLVGSLKAKKGGV